MKLFAHGDMERNRITAKRLDEAAAQLEKASDDRIAEVREMLIYAWSVRLEDLLEERPNSAGELQDLIEQIRADLPAVQKNMTQASDTGSVFESNSGGINITNTGVSGDTAIHIGQPGPEK